MGAHDRKSNSPTPACARSAPGTAHSFTRSLLSPTCLPGPELNRSLEDWVERRFRVTRQQAEDLAQDARVALGQKLGWSAMAVAPGVVYSFAARLAANYIRNERARRSILSSSRGPDAAEGPRLMEEVDVRCALESFCQRVGLSHDAGILFAAVIQGIEYGQLAALTGERESTIRKRIARARRRIRQLAERTPV